MRTVAGSAMPRTERARGAICLRACYAMPGSDYEYAATPPGQRDCRRCDPAESTRGCLFNRADGTSEPLICYALAARCPVLTQGVLVLGP
eukprot:3269185-Rhodomonas_salina.5